MGKEFKTEAIRNIAIIGGAQVGKTSLGEAMLFDKGITTRLGKVDDGTSNLDFQADEIAKKISISSATFQIEEGNSKLNFIDTPGYPGFVSQMITAVHTCETSLVVVCADSGIEVLTKKGWRLSEQLNQPRFVFVNRMDRDRVDFARVLDQIKNYSSKVHPILIPIGQGEALSGVVDIMTQKAYMVKDGKTEVTDVPQDMKDTVEIYRSELMECAAENSEELLEKYLEAGELSEEDFIKGVRMGIVSGDIIPLMAGSATKGVGIKRMLEVLETFAPNPIEAKKEWSLTNGETIQLNTNGSTTLQVFKIVDDPKLGEYFFLKVIQGSLRVSQELTNLSCKQKERFGHLFLFNGKNRDEVPVLNAGDIGATAKLKSVSICDTLTDAKDGVALAPFEFPTPIITEAVYTESEKDREKMGEGLQSARRLDPCLNFKQESDQMLVSANSKLQIDVALDRINLKYNITVLTEAPKIPYRETITSPSKAQGKHKKQSGGHGQYGDCWVELKPRQSGEGYLFTNKISGGVIPSKYLPAVDKGVQEAMTRGILAGYNVVDVEAVCYDGSYHAVDSSDLAFQMAGILAFKKAAEAANPIILEPIMSVKVTIPEHCVGDVSADFNQRRGKIASMDSGDDGYKIISATVPQSELYHYAIDLKSMTKGDMEYEEAFERYEMVPAHITKKIISEREKEKELARA